MNPDTWFEQLASALVGEVGVAGSPQLVSDDERDALLDLARVAAHTSERWTAPISTFVVGAALHDRSSEERAATLRRLVTLLEPDTPTDAASDHSPTS